MKNILLILIMVVSTLSYSQEATTFILIRHAEKVADGSKNPVLTSEGEARAEHLLEMFIKADLTAIYSTDFNRTRMTVEPLAKMKGVEVQNYDWKNQEELLKKLLEENEGGAIIIVGHSNTTPYLANLLVGKKVLNPFQDDDYGNLLIITTTKVGNGKMMQIRY